MIQLRISNNMKPEHSMGAHQGQITKRVDLLANNQPKLGGQKVKIFSTMKCCVNGISSISFDPDTTPVHKPRKINPVSSDILTQGSNIINPTITLKNIPNKNEAKKYSITLTTKSNDNCVGLSSDHIKANGVLNDFVGVSHQSQLKHSNVITTPLNKSTFLEDKTPSVLQTNPQTTLTLPCDTHPVALKRLIEGSDNSSSTVFKKFKYFDKTHSPSIFEPKPYKLSPQEILNIFVTSLVFSFKFHKISFIASFIRDYRKKESYKEILSMYSDEILFDYLMRDYFIALDDTEHFIFQSMRDYVEELLEEKIAACQRTHFKKLISELFNKYNVNMSFEYHDKIRDDEIKRCSSIYDLSKKDFLLYFLERNLNINELHRKIMIKNLPGISQTNKVIFYKKELLEIFDTKKTNLSRNFTIDTIVYYMLNSSLAKNINIFTRNQYTEFYLKKNQIDKKFNNYNTQCKNKQYIEKLKKMLILDYDNKHMVIETYDNENKILKSKAYDIKHIVPETEIYTPTILPSIESDLFSSLTTL